VTVFFYLRGVEREISALAGAAAHRRHDPGVVDRSRRHRGHPRPGRRRQRRPTAGCDARFRAVAAAEPDFSDLYVMRRGPDAASADVRDRRGDHRRRRARPARRALSDRARPGPCAPASRRPTVEDEPYPTPGATVLSGYAPIRDRAGEAVAIVGVDVRATRLAAIKREVAVVAVAVLVASRSSLRHAGGDRGAQRAHAAGAHLRGHQRDRGREAHGADRSWTRSDEFGVVGRHFDEMATGLEEREFIKATFGQYVAPEVVARMLSDRSARGARGSAATSRSCSSTCVKFTTLSRGAGRPRRWSRS
jgi:hypothetical protein